MSVDDRKNHEPFRWFSITALRYAVVSVVVFVIDLGLLALLNENMPLLAANSIAFLVANVVQFMAAHIWVFGMKLNDSRLLSTYTSVVLISVVGLLINDLIVWLSVAALGAGLMVAKILATATAWGWNYQARRRWIYRGHSL